MCGVVGGCVVCGVWCGVCMCVGERRREEEGEGKGEGRRGGVGWGAVLFGRSGLSGTISKVKTNF